MGQMGFSFNMNKCTGCKSCVIACKEVKNLEVGVNYRKVHHYEGGTFPQVWTASLSIACNHCAQPSCLTACPVAAITKDGETGLVVQDQRMCIVCERCVRACPYGEPAYVASLLSVGKCDGCIEYIKQGSDPVCVAACSTRTLRFGELEELRKSYGSLALTSDLPVLADSSQTTPSLLIVARPEMLNSAK
ncbi:MAG: dimethyl sulfoxide reductase subunit B [Coriobacteriales bacterium]|jgi:anaerobic dimethyl sulfoxide reductase subunit B (iron-sulfur subunit)|nr:dimethyl sulfoxide reductase subunit B [Coriobacteriales bacterium]